MLEFKILTHPYLVTPQTRLFIDIRYPSGSRLKTTLMHSEDTFYCCKAKYKNSNVIIFWDVKNRFFATEEKDAKKHFYILMKSQAKNNEVLNNFKHSLVKLYH